MRSPLQESAVICEGRALSLNRPMSSGEPKLRCIKASPRALLLSFASSAAGAPRVVKFRELAEMRHFRAASSKLMSMSTFSSLSAEYVAALQNQERIDYRAL